MNTTIEARVEGYRYALSESVDGVSEEIAADAAAGGNSACREAFLRGVLDDLAALRADMEMQYISIADAAAEKGVSVQAVRDVLRNENRRLEIFPSSYFEGDNRRRGEWRLQIEEVKLWQPRRKS